MDPTALLSALQKDGAPGHPLTFQALSEFNSHNKDFFARPVSQFANQKELLDILFRLINENDVNGKPFEDGTSEKLKELFSCLRILSRGKDFALVISSSQAYITTLLSFGKILGDAKHGNCIDFASELQTNKNLSRSTAETVEALKVVCNCIFHCNDFREQYKKRCCSKVVSEKLDGFQKNEAKDTNLMSILVKILFLMSALDTDDRDKMRLAFNTVSILIKALDEELKNVEEEITYDGDGNNIKEMNIHCELAAEILKTLFNLSVKLCDESLLGELECNNYCQLVGMFQGFLSSLSFKYDAKISLIGHIANVLINMQSACLQRLIPAVRRRQWQDSTPHKNGFPTEYELKDMSAVITLVQLLDEDLKHGYGEPGEKSQAFSILVSLCHICRTLRLVRKYLRSQILPPLRDVSVRPEESKTLKGRIIKLMTHPDTNIKNIAADFLFVLCKENPDRLVKHTGYGNAAGLFAARGLLGGINEKTTIVYSSDDDDSDTEEYSAVADLVDPITGGIDSKSVANPLENMTDEEKEASATELMSLIDRMSSLDVIKPMKIGEDGHPQEVDTEEAKKILKAQINKDNCKK